MQYAYGTLPFEYHKGWGHFDMRIDTQTLTPEGLPTISLTAPVSGSLDGVYFLHGILLYIPWGAMLVVQISSARYLKHFWLLNMWVHGITGTIAAGLTIYASAIMIVQLGEIEDDFSHALQGFIFLILALMMIMGGYTTKLMQERLRWRTFYLRTTARVHKYAALVIVALGTWLILTGMEEYDEFAAHDGKYIWLFFLHLGAHVVLFAVLEVIFRLWRNKSGPLTAAPPKVIMSHEEYEQALKSGKKYVILDDLILDVSLYMSRHPGG